MSWEGLSPVGFFGARGILGVFCWVFGGSVDGWKCLVGRVGDCCFVVVVDCGSTDKVAAERKVYGVCRGEDGERF